MSPTWSPLVRRSRLLRGRPLVWGRQRGWVGHGRWVRFLDLEEGFKACLANQKVLSGIEWVRDRAHEKFEVNATPTFFINAQKYTGDMSIGDLNRAIQQHLES